MWHTAIVTATEWSNFFHLRNNDAAHPDIHQIAAMMQVLYEECKPLDVGYWAYHLPLVYPEDYEAVPGMRNEFWKMVSVGRCARVSYLTHEGKRDPQADVELHDRLLAAGHLSPFEHVAVPSMLNVAAFSGNFRGWVQYRKMLPNEADILGAH
jgi:thymidylate synthase ThyX